MIDKEKICNVVYNLLNICKVHSFVKTTMCYIHRKNTKDDRNVQYIQQLKNRNLKKKPLKILFIHM